MPTSVKDTTGMAKKQRRSDNDTAAADKVGAVGYAKRRVNIVARGEDCSAACGANVWFAL